MSVRAADTTLEKLYPTLSPRERLRAALLATARRDERQLDRLRCTCPKKVYEQRDAAFTDALEASYLTTMRFVGLWTHVCWMHDVALLRRRLYETRREALARGFVLGANVAWEEAGRAAAEGPYFEDDGRALPWEEAAGVAAGADAAGELPAALRALEDERREVVRQMKAYHAGLLRFCARVGLEPEQVLAWNPPVLRGLADAEAALRDETVPLDEELAEQAALAFSEGWPDAMLREEGAETR